MKFLKTLARNVEKQVGETLSSFGNVAKQVFVFMTTLSALAWFSAFFYGTFYYYYVPVVAQEKPVYFHFRVCESGVGVCSFPFVNISLLKEGQHEVFKRGQRYSLVLDMDVPETETNRHLGMFMIEMKLYNKKSEIIFTSARAASLHHKSNLLSMIETLVFSPFYLLGYMNQKQYLHVELASDYIDSTYNPSVGVLLEIQNMQVQVYTATFKMFAQFSGVRYFLYYWPITSAVVGISWNFLLLGFMSLLSWYHFWLPETDRQTFVTINLPGRQKQDKAPKKDSKEATSKGSLETVGSAEGGDEETQVLRAADSPEVDQGLRLRRPNAGTM